MMLTATTLDEWLEAKTSQDDVCEWLLAQGAEEIRYRELPLQQSLYAVPNEELKSFLASRKKFVNFLHFQSGAAAVSDGDIPYIAGSSQVSAYLLFNEQVFLRHKAPQRKEYNLDPTRIFVPARFPHEELYEIAEKTLA